MSASETTSALLVDAHVHFHPCYAPRVFFDAARANFTVAARRAGLPESTLGCLLLAECSWHDYFRAFAEGRVDLGPHWSMRATQESGSLIAYRDDRPAMVMLAGRQIITAERLEVLALACHRAFPDGMKVEAVLESSLACGAVTVLPWGCGKWLGRRGRKVKELLDSPWSQRIHLGDNGGRPALSLAPPLFAAARERHIAILPGTDPLALPWQVGRAGRYGFIHRTPLSLLTPAADLKAALCENSVQPPTYGRRESLVNFVRANVGVRLARRRAAADNGQMSALP